MLLPITEDVYQYKDNCNVYLIKSGSKGLLIDPGSGSVLHHLQEAGIQLVDTVLLTHAHRDQCSGIQALINHKAAIKAPRDEKPYLGKQEVKNYWDRHFPAETSTTNYSVLGQGFDEVECILAPGDIIIWEGIRIEAIAADGHTPGQLAYLLSLQNDRELLFSGDALYRAGKVWKGYTMDWDHWTDAGVQAACQTLERFRQYKPTMIAPSHGEVMDGDVDAQLSATHESLMSYGTNKSFENFHTTIGGRTASPRIPALSTFTSNGKTVKQLSEHLWVHDNHYFLLSDSKQCLMVDCGYAYMEQLVPEFLREVGCSTVDVVIPSHAHIDHVEYLNILKARYGTQIWALDLICDVLEEPLRYWHPWSKWSDIHIDRIFRDGERVVWNEYELRLHWYPGQTAFALAVEAIVDGKHVLFTGDNFFPVEQWTGTGGIMGLNRGLPMGHGYSAAKTIEISPEWILAGHEFPFIFDYDEFRNRVNWAKEVSACMVRLSPEGEWRVHFDPHAISIYPFLSQVTRGQRIVAWIQGEESDLIDPDFDMTWDLPRGFQIQLLLNESRQVDNSDRRWQPPTEEEFRKLRFSSGSMRRYAFEIIIPHDVELGSHAIYLNSKRNSALEAMCIVRVFS
jgi:glyoxylase-like metal-dependent hydrolase (beta-lactamase superfamily II)